MPTFYLTKRVTKPGANLDHLGVRLDLVMDSEPAEIDLSEGASSSSYDVQQSSLSLSEVSSSSAIAAYEAIFLYKRTEDGDFFLDICSPADLETWPVDAPAEETGFYRSRSVSLTFRAESVMDDAYNSLWGRVEALSDALTILASLCTDEEVSYDFTSDDSLDSSSSSGVRRFTLSRDALTPYPSDAPVGYRLHVTCAAEGADHKIFLWRDDLADRDGEIKKRPIAVCSPGDLVDYPVDAALDTQFPAHYRLEEWDIVSSDLSLLNSTWIGIKSDVSQLARVLAIHLGVATETEERSKGYYV